MNMTFHFHENLLKGLNFSLFANFYFVQTGFESEKTRFEESKPVSLWNVKTAKMC